jgi:hypothetical protein
MTAVKLTLETLQTYTTETLYDLPLPFSVEMQLTERPAPAVLHNLAKLKKLGICSGDALMSLVGVAPIDPINLMWTLMQSQPDGWRFSTFDFSMMRVLARTSSKAVAAALQVDLMAGTLTGLALNNQNQLTVFKTFDVEPGPDTLALIQALCDETVAAAVREVAP